MMQDEIYLKTYKTLESAELGGGSRWKNAGVIRRIWVCGGILGLAATVSAGLWLAATRFDPAAATNTDRAVREPLPGEKAIPRDARMLSRTMPAPSAAEISFRPQPGVTTEADYATVKGPDLRKPNPHTRSFDASLLPPAASRISARPAKPVEAPRPPDLAPVAVAGNSTAVLDRYLAAAPTAAPVNPPAAMSVQVSAKKVADAREVLAALQKYSEAWSNRRVPEITALRPGLTRRAVQQELSSARSITMDIEPTSVPKIEGDRATVECIHHVNQVFTDGVEKQNPGLKMTYTLVKRGSSWLIEGSR